MSEIWNEFNRRIAAWRQAGDTERLKLSKHFYAASPFRETDPGQAFVLYTRGRDEARRLQETWWELFFEHHRLSTLTADLEDYARALPLAIELMVRFNSPEGKAHCWRVSVLIDVLCTYANVDAFGYREALEHGFAHLDEQITRGPDSTRFILHHRWTDYLIQAGRWDEAFELAQRTLALVDQAASANTRIWHGAWTLFYLCRICYALGRMDELAGHAVCLAETSEKGAQLRRAQADGWLWFAVTQRARGMEQDALRSFRRGKRLLKGLESCDTISADPIAYYYEQGSDWKAALGVRDRELAVITKKGRLDRCCEIQIERCRLLSLAGELTPGDVDKARLSAAQLRVPDGHLKKLDGICRPE